MADEQRGLVAQGVAGHLLVTGLLGLLIGQGKVDGNAVVEMIDFVLLKLEESQKGFGPAVQLELDAARKLLAQSRTVFGGPIGPQGDG